MDLSERRGAPLTRHPWETSRVEAIESIIRRLGLAGDRVLDVGCGDGFLARELQQRLGFRELVGQDIHLSDDLASSLSGRDVRFVRELTGLDYRAELILLLDVLEHLENPRLALTTLARERLATGGHMLVTVPAFQSLFTEHDVALKHVRRYSRLELADEVVGAGLTVCDSGYLFSSLLVPRALTALRERMRPRRAQGKHGIGEWTAPTLLTRAIHAGLTLDNSICLAARGFGLTIPGLSVWLTCKTPS